MIGSRFGRLVVIGNSSKRDRSRQLFYLFRCDCGVEKEIGITAVRKGAVVSCGCYGKEMRKLAMTTHNMTQTPTYFSWGSMIQRCTNPNNLSYSRYGGRGITVCEEWKTFEKFFEDMGECPEGHSIERKDVNAGYNKENCVWADATEQARNQRLHKRNKSGVRGVCWKELDKAWFAYITTDYKQKSLGYFKRLEDAITARLKAEKELWGRVYQKVGE